MPDTSGADLTNIIARGLAFALTRLQTIPSTQAGTAAFLRELGFEPPVGLQTLLLDATKLQALAQATDTLESDLISGSSGSLLPEYGAVLVAAAAVVDDILTLGPRLTQSLDPAYVAASQIAIELPRRLLDWLVMEQLSETSRPLLYSLAIAGIVELVPVEADPPTYTTRHLRRVLHPENLPKLVTAPAQYLATWYGWGTATPHVDRFLQNVLLLANACGVPVQLLDSGQTGATPGDEGEFPIISSSDGATFEAGIRLTLASASAVPHGALAVVPYIQGSASADFPLGAGLWSLTVAAGAAATLGGLLIEPSAGTPPGVQVSVITTLGASVDFGIGLKRAKQDGSPSTLVTMAPMVLVAKAIKVELVFAGSSSAPADLTLNLSIVGGSLHLGLASGDGFLASILPKDMTIDFDAKLTISSSHGVHFEGGAGLEIAIPVHISLPVITITGLSLAAHAAEDGTHIDLAASGAAAIGPITASVASVGVRLTLVQPPAGGNVGPAALSASFKPPTGIGLSVDATAITGGGFLSFDSTKQEYAGILDLEFADRFSLKVIVVLDTQNGFSLMGLIFVENFTPIPLGLGFFLEGVGGMLAINRTAAVDKLRAGLKSGSMNSLLFPEAPVKHAHQIIADLDADFPRADNRYLFGPMAEITWGDPTLVTIKIALLIELPEPVRLIIIAKLEALLPDPDKPLVKLHMDAIGVVNFGTDDLSLDAVLYDSKMAEFTVTGAMALRMNWGVQPNFALAVGGFSPSYTPPANFPKVARIVIALAAGDNPRIKLDAYLAITSNTFQVGSHLDLHAGAGGFAIDGHLGFDVLIHFDPFAFLADMHASLSLSYNGSVLMGVDLHLTLSGPSPLHAMGTATFQVWIFSASVSFDMTIGDALPPGPVPALPDLEKMLVDAFKDLRNWSAIMPADSKSAVAVRPRAPVGQQVFVHPLGDLSVHERVVPLGLSINNYGTIPLTTPVTFAIDSVSIRNSADSNPQPIKDFFAPAQFLQLSDSQKLARPSFEEYQSGLRFGFSKPAGGTVVQSVIGYTTEVVEGPAVKAAMVTQAAAVPAGQDYQVPGDSLLKQIPTGAAARAQGNTTGTAKYAGVVRSVDAGQTTYALADSSDLTQPKTFSDTLVTYSQATDLLRQNVGAYPQLQIVVSHEPRRFTPNPLTTLTFGKPARVPAPNEWISSRTQLTIAPNAGASLRALYYRVYAQGTNAPKYAAIAVTGATFSISGSDGIYKVEWFGVDPKGVEETPQLHSVQLDNTIPSATLSAPRAISGGAQMTLTAADTGSGVQWVSYQVFAQGAAAPGYTTQLGGTTDITIKGEGTFEVDFQAGDNVGNVAPQQATAVKTDTTPPQSTLTVGAPGYPANPTFVTPSSTLLLSATDAGSGVQSVLYQFYAPGNPPPGFTTTPGPSAQFKITGLDGPYQVEFKGIDNAGNVEAVHVQTITLDSTAPQSQLVVGDPKLVGPSTFVASTTPLTINSVDAGSGVASISYSAYRKGGVAPKPKPFATFTLTGTDGEYEVDYQAADNLGNLETMHSDFLYLDTTAPVITVTSPTPTTYVQAAGATLVLHYAATDGTGSGMASLTSTLDGIPTHDGDSFLLTALTKGYHTFVATAVDNVGNKSTASVQFTVS
jgi:hypothetical protein